MPPRKKAPPRASTDAPYIHEQLRHLAVPVDKLAFDPDNARHHDAKNVVAVSDSLTRFGQYLPIVVQKQGMVVRVGNCRLQAAKNLGWAYIAALVVDESDVDAVARAITDNRTSELGSWDHEALLRGLDLVDAAGVDLQTIGFDADDLQDLIPKIDAPPEPPSVDDAPDVPPPDDPGDADEDPAGDAPAPFVRFRFGRVAGQVGQDVYDEFCRRYEAARGDGAVMLDDVLREWLNGSA